MLLFKASDLYIDSGSITTTKVIIPKYVKKTAATRLEKGDKSNTEIVFPGLFLFIPLSHEEDFIVSENPLQGLVLFTEKVTKVTVKLYIFHCFLFSCNLIQIISIAGKSKKNVF